MHSSRTSRPWVSNLSGKRPQESLWAGLKVERAKIAISDINNILNYRALLVYIGIYI